MKKSILSKVLLGIGISKANVDKMVENTPEDTGSVLEEKDITALIEAHKEAQLALYKNDPEIIKEIESSIVGRELSKFDRKMKQEFGLTAEEVKDKSTEEIIKLAKTKVTSNSDKTLVQLQEELIAKTNKIKELEETEIPKIKSEVDNHKKQFTITDKLTKKVSAHKLRNPLEDVLASVGTLNSVYDIDLDDKGELVYYVKGSKLIPKNADGSKLLTADEIIKGKLESGKFLVESNADEIDPATGKVKIIVTDEKNKGKEEVFKSVPGYGAAQEHLEKMRAEKAAKA